MTPLLHLAYALAPGPTDLAGVDREELRGKFEILRELGYEGVEVAIGNPREVSSEFLRWLEGHGLKLVSILTGRGFVAEALSLCAADTAIRNRAIDRLESYFELAARWEALVFIGLLRGRANGDPDATVRLVDSLQRACAAAAPLGVRLIIEPTNRYEADLIPTVASAASIIAKIGAPNIGIVPDTYHMNIEERSILGAIREHAALVWHVQVVDNNREAPGFGHLDFPEILRTLREIGYRGYVSAEVMPVPDFSTAARQSLNHLRTSWRADSSAH
jgi:sugar phosphate isomerase/epimerase